MSQEAQRHDDVEPACGASLTGADSSWTAVDPAAYPRGYPRLCTDCFEDAEVEADGRAPDYDHESIEGQFVRTTGSNNTTRRMHREAGGDQ